MVLFATAHSMLATNIHKRKRGSIGTEAGPIRQNTREGWYWNRGPLHILFATAHNNEHHQHHEHHHHHKQQAAAAATSKTNMRSHASHTSLHYQGRQYVEASQPGHGGWEPTNEDIHRKNTIFNITIIIEGALQC